MSYTTGLEMILDIERELRNQSTAHAWAIGRARQDAPRRSLRSLRAAIAARVLRVTHTAKAVTSPSAPTVACCA